MAFNELRNSGSTCVLTLRDGRVLNFGLTDMVIEKTVHPWVPGQLVYCVRITASPDWDEVERDLVEHALKSLAMNGAQHGRTA